ncbi:hypothetical protein [Nocardia farcinica]|uniref:hypothetical protein n=1 Tax=Nocardia farcinica TaxID=37329 RepID=UPI00189385BF|nr:hypothetical protein [Nocardia farcinica]MBF6523097.1 hypothetical protein [Nocardia farcinica]
MHEFPYLRWRRLLAAFTSVAALAPAAGCADDRATAADPGRQRPADLVAVPAEVHWRDYRGVAIPVGADGPTHYTDAAATGFVRSPQGAALAAMVHTVRMSLVPDEHWASVAAHELAPGPGKDSWAAGRVLVSVTGTADPATAPRLRGYTITEYTPDRAQVQIYTSFPDTSVAVNTSAVTWVGNDWRLHLPDPASTDPVVVAVPAVDADVPLEAPR